MAMRNDTYQFLGKQGLLVAERQHQGEAGTAEEICCISENASTHGHAHMETKTDVHHHADGVTFHHKSDVCVLVQV